MKDTGNTGLEHPRATEDSATKRPAAGKGLGKRIAGLSAGCLFIVPLIASAFALGFLTALFAEWCRYDSTRGYKAWEAATITVLVGGSILFSLWRKRRPDHVGSRKAVTLVRRVWALIFDLLLGTVAFGAALAYEVAGKGTLGAATIPFCTFLMLLFLGRDARGGALSPGRRLLGYRIAGPDGKACSLSRSYLRNLLPFGAPLLWMLYKLVAWGPFWCQSLGQLIELHTETPVSVVVYLSFVLAVGLIDLGHMKGRADGRRTGDQLAGTQAVQREQMGKSAANMEQ